MKTKLRKMFEKMLNKIEILILFLLRNCIDLFHCRNLEHGKEKKEILFYKKMYL